MLANDVYYSFVRRICLLGGNLPVKARFQKRWRACLIRCIR